MRRNPNQRRVVVALQEGVGVVQRDRAVDRDRVMQGLEERPALAVQVQDARAHALVVVDDVEVAAARLQDLLDPHRIGQRLTEAAAQHDGELAQVGQGRELRGRRHAEGVGVAVEVEGRHGGEAHALVEFGPRWPREDLDAVAEATSSRVRWRV
jgi:hypothetical protein